jgi:hypothetical protein
MRRHLMRKLAISESTPRSFVKQGKAFRRALINARRL